MSIVANKEKTETVRVHHPVFLPGEAPEDYEALRESLMKELAPGSAYEAILAHNLVLLEWDAIRHRRLRDELILSSYVMAAAEMLDEGIGGPKSEALIIAQGLTMEDPALQSEALEAIAKRGYVASDMVAAGYQKSHPVIQAHENRLAEIERRRTKLREELTQGKNARRRRDNDSTVVRR